MHDKKKLRMIILELVKSGFDLTSVMQAILDIHKSSHLPSIIENYVHNKFFKYCVQILENELQRNIPTWDINHLRQVATKIFTARKLAELPSEITVLKHFQLVVNERGLLTKEDKLRILYMIQMAVAGIVYDCTIEASRSKDKVTSLLQLIKEQTTLVLSAYAFNDSDFHQHLDSYHEHYSADWKRFKKDHPKEAREHEKLHKEYQDKIQTIHAELVKDALLHDTLEELKMSLVTELTARGTIDTLYQNGREMIVLKKPVMVLSCVLDRIDHRIKWGDGVEEVHLIAAEVIYIDCDLKNKVWHGKNILVMSKKIEIIVPGLVWDVGGNDGEDASTSKAEDGTDIDLDGEDGSDGEPGESGGYGTLIADKFVNLHYLTFNSCGGYGGSGQDGGDGRNGKDGRDGEEMSMDELKQDFESPAINKRGNEDGEPMERTIPRVLHKIDNMETSWTHSLDLETGQRSSLTLEHNCYMRGSTSNGLNIEFGFYFREGLPPFTAHCYMLVKGAPGTAGKLGGFGGIGGCAGEGGFRGTLSAFYLNGQNYNWENSPVCNSKNGSSGGHGDDGKDGARGKCGSNGRDVGYIDNMWWTKTVYYEPGTYQLKSFTEKPDSYSMWCPYFKKWRRFYTDHKDPPQPLEQQRAKQRRVKLNVCSQKKNTINSSQVLDMYENEVRNSCYSDQLGNLEFDQKLRDIITLNQSFLKRNKTKKRKITKIGISKPAFSTKHCRTTRRSILKNPLQCKDKSPEQITKVRFQVLEKIQANLSSSWKNWAKKKVEHEKYSTSTKSHCSALHALFGKVNKLGYYEAPCGKRKDVCAQLRKFKFSDKEKNAGECLRECILAYFQDEIQPSQVTSLAPHLDELCNKFRANPESFDWNWLSEESKAVGEYFDFLEESSTPFLTCDLKLVAQVYGRSLEVYVTSSNSPMCIPLEPMKIGDADRTADDHIAVNKNHEFSKMVAVVRRDMREIYEMQENIVNEVYSLGTEAELKQYLLENKFGTRTMPKIKIEDKKLLEIVRDISHGMSDCNEQLLVKTALLGWPPILVQVFHDKLMMAGMQCKDKHHQVVIRDIFSKITEYSIGENSAEKLAQLLWVISTCSLGNWISQVLLIVGEEHFKTVGNEDIEEWRKIAVKFPPTLIAAILKLVETGFDREDKAGFLDFLKKIEKFELNENMDFDKLSGVSKSEWPFHLRKMQISSKLEGLPNVSWNDDDNKFSQALYYLHALYNLKEKQVTKLLDALYKMLSVRVAGKNCLEIAKILANFYGGQWTLDEKCVELLGQCKNVDEWMSLLQKESEELLAGSSRSLQEIQTIIGTDSNTTLTSEEIQNVAEMVKSLDGIRPPDGFSTDFDSTMCQWVSQFKVKIKGKAMSSKSLMKEQLEAVAVINMVIEMKLGYSLRPTQKFAIITALYLGTHGNNLLSQIATGEGKTCVVLAVAIVMGLFGEKVDVVTSSGVLAQRDANSYRSIYSAFGLSVGEVTGDDQDARVRAYQCHIVYGESTHFQRDFLLDRFYNQNIRGSRIFSSVIVDEVDSMFLDKGNSVLYLSHQPPDLDCLESIFVFIWGNVVRTINSGEFHPMRVHELVLSAIYPTLSPDDLTLFLEAREVSPLWDWMLSKKIINENGRLLLSSMDKIGTLLDMLPANYLQWRHQITHLLNSSLESPEKLSVINYLKPFVEHHLFSWVKSAVHAMQLTEGKEYIVDVDHSKTSLDKNPKIMILDLDTGVDLKESQWNEGLHQFLQLKHGCRLSLMSLKAVFISNISFFNKYKRIFGLTGTIGTESDRNFLKMTYNVKILCIPLALPKRFVEWEPQILSNLGAWKQQVFQECKDIAVAGRSALVICGTVQEAEILHAHISSEGTIPTTAIELYRRDYETFEAAEQDHALEPGRVLIATNLAGRGTDIKLSPKLKENGGLHLILSYLPDNLRVEQQAFGRASRCGDLGSGRLIVFDTISNNPDADAINLKIQRDNLEMLRVSEIQCYYANVIKKEELVFELFRESFEKLTGALDNAYEYVKDHDKGMKDADESRNMIHGNINEVRELVMYSLLDDWAFWLDRYSTLLVSKQDPDKLAMIDKGLHQFELDEDVLKQDFQRMTGRYEQVSVKYEDPEWLQSTLDWCKRTVGVRIEAQIEGYALSLIHEPALLVKVAKCMINRKDYDTAIRYMDRVVEEENDHSVVAHYYKVLCKIKKKQVNSTEFDKMIATIREKLDECRIRQASYCSVARQVKYVDTQKILHGDGYKKQKDNVMKLLGIYRQSIDNIVGSERILPSDFASVCSENVSEHLCEHLMKMGALLRPQFVLSSDSEKLQTVADSYCVSRETLHDILKRFHGKYLRREEEKTLKQELDLPSRSDFWKQIHSCLEDITEFAVIQDSGRDDDDNGKKSKKQNDFTGWVREGREFISKYGSDMSASTKNQYVLMGRKQDFQKEQKFIRFRKIGKLCYEQAAYLNLDKLKALKLTKYHKGDAETFSLIPGIGEAEAGKIFGLLQKHNIIDENGVLLTTEWTKDTLQLTREFEVYRTDILSILHSKCRYQYQILSLVSQTELAAKAEEKQEYNELKISLPSRPCKEFIMTAMEQGFILGMRANPGYFVDSGGVVNFCSNVFREPVAWGKWVAKQIDKIEATKPHLSWDDLKKLFPNESVSELNKLYEELKASNWINSNGEIILDAFKDGELKQLSPQFEYHQPEVYSLAEWRREMAEDNFLDKVLVIVYESQGKLCTLESPDGQMVKLEKILEGYPDGGAELMEQVNMFALSGFDHLVQATEEKYTWKMIVNAVVVIAIGLTQVVVGVIAQVYTVGFGTYVAGGLIQEGISDMIYGVMAFSSGHFSWQEWADHKWRSIAITCVTMSIGAMISKGVKFSKFGHKCGLPDKCGRELLETLNRGGAAGITRSINPVILKSIGYKVLQACAVAGGSMAVSFVYDRALNKFIEGLSSQIFNNVSEAITNHSISSTLSKLVDLVGVVKAREIVDRCRNHVMSDSSFETDAHHYFSQIATPVINGWKEAVGKLISADKSPGKNTLTTLKLLSYVMSTAAVVNALVKMNNSIKSHLDKMERKIVNEMSAVDKNEIGQVVVSKKEKDGFENDFKTKTNALIREKIGAVMRHNIVQPLMDTGCQKLLVWVGRRARREIVKFNEAKIKKKLDKMDLEIKSNSDTPEERKIALHKQVQQLVSKSRDPKLVAYAVESGALMGVECVQAVANLYGVTIVIDSDIPDMRRTIVPQNGNNCGVTLHLRHSVNSSDPNDLGHFEAPSGAGESAGVGNYSANCLLDALNPQLKAVFPDMKAMGRKDVAECIRNDPFLWKFIKMGWHHTYNALGGFGGARCQDFQLIGKAEHVVAQHLSDIEAELRETGDLQPAPNNFPNNPIIEVAFKKVRGEDVSYYLLGIITPDTMANPQPRDRKETKAVKEGGDALPNDDVGHAFGVGSGGPSIWYNMFCQNSSENRGVYRCIEQHAHNFIRNNLQDNPSVGMKVLLGREENNRRPNIITLHFTCMKNKVVVEEKVFILPNEPSNLPRKANRGNG